MLGIGKGKFAMTIANTKLTAHQFQMLGADPPGVRLELVHGEIRVSPSPSYQHGLVENHLRFLLTEHILQEDLGELVGDIDTLLDDLNVRRPDLIFIAKAQLHLLNDDEHGISFAPDLCVEILSPGSATIDQTDKFDLYAKAGVAHYWMVDPVNKTFAAFKLSRKRYVKAASGVKNETVIAPPFPKLKIPLARLWPPSRKA